MLSLTKNKKLIDSRSYHSHSTKAHFSPDFQYSEQVGFVFAWKQGPETVDSYGNAINTYMARKLWVWQHPPSSEVRWASVFKNNLFT